MNSKDRFVISRLPYDFNDPKDVLSDFSMLQDPRIFDMAQIAENKNVLFKLRQMLNQQRKDPNSPNFKASVDFTKTRNQSLDQKYQSIDLVRNINTS